MSIIGVLSLREIETREGYFNATFNFVKEKCEENWAIFRNYYLEKY